MKRLFNILPINFKKDQPSNTLRDQINKVYANYYKEEISKPLAKQKVPFREISSGISHYLIDKEILREELKAFFDFYKHSYPNHKYFAIQFKLTLENGGSKSISHIQISKLEDFDILLEVFFTLFSRKFDDIEISEDIDYAERPRVGDEDDEDDDYPFNQSLPAGVIIFGFMPLTTVDITKYST